MAPKCNAHASDHRYQNHARRSNSLQHAPFPGLDAASRCRTGYGVPRAAGLGVKQGLWLEGGRAAWVARPWERTAASYRRTSRLITPAPVPRTARAVGAQKAYIHLRPLFTSASPVAIWVLSSALRRSHLASQAASRCSSLASSSAQRVPHLASSSVQRPPQLASSSAQRVPHLASSSVQRALHVASSSASRRSSLASSSVQRALHLASSSASRRSSLASSSVQRAPHLASSSARRCSSFASKRAKLSSFSSRRSARYAASTALNQSTSSFPQLFAE